MAASTVLQARLQALSSVATTVTSPQQAAPARACTCCSGRFEDPALLHQAAEAAEGLDTAALRAACASSAAVRSEALRLAIDLLPAALLLNMEPFMQHPGGVSRTELPLPQELFFTFLQVEHDLCVALFPLLSAEERHRVLRALVPLLHGTLDASGCGYGHLYLLRVRKVRPVDYGTWVGIGGNFGPFFFAAEVKDEGVLDLIRRHDLQDFFWAFIDGAREAQHDSLPAKWVDRL